MLHWANAGSGSVPTFYPGRQSTMTVRARRIYYSLATLVFLIVAPILLAIASGYRWIGLEQGFVKTGALFITATSRAEVFLNDQPMGSTPKRFTHLRPGIYQVSVRQNGLQSWERLIRVSPDVAEIIGPITLFPAAFQRANIDLKGATGVLADPVGNRIIGWQRQSTGWLSRDLWPSTDRLIQLTSQPTAVHASPHDQIRLYESIGEVAVVQTTGNQIWTLAPFTALRWSQTSDHIFYGQRLSQVYRFDALAKTETALTTGLSYSIQNDSIWSSTTVGTVTTIYQQAAYGQASSQVVTTIDGDWRFIDGPPNTLLMQRQSDHLLAELRQTASSPVLRSFGQADDWWWSSVNEPLVWQNGLELSMRLSDGTNTLIDRSGAITTEARWVSPEHLLLTLDQRHVTIRSTSQRQGRSTLLSQAFDADVTSMMFDRTQRLIVTVSQEPTPMVTAWSWSTTPLKL
ncbi:MAG: PEGA domain-containing protein [Candidatus Kerfeldbacteria bacterium]|nr:PEGA domain-containing protein [Candidatus Kerfeldbacteria bacterium]